VLFKFHFLSPSSSGRSIAWPRMWRTHHRCHDFRGSTKDPSTRKSAPHVSGIDYQTSKNDGSPKIDERTAPANATIQAAARPPGPSPAEKALFASILGIFYFCFTRISTRAQQSNKRAFVPDDRELSTFLLKFYERIATTGRRTGVRRLLVLATHFYTVR
jgi:hypothetical protein